MNLAILLKILSSLSVVTERVATRDNPNGIMVSQYALSLKQALEIVALNPDNALALNRIIGECVCNDWQTFEEVGKFVASCLTDGKASRIPQALGAFNNMASMVVQAQ